MTLSLVEIIALGAGFLSTFMGILVWSKVREPAWFFVVLGVTFLYIEEVYRALTRLHLIQEFVSLFYMGMLSTLSSVFFTLGFLLFLLRRRRL